MNQMDTRFGTRSCRSRNEYSRAVGVRVWTRWLEKHSSVCIYACMYVSVYAVTWMQACAYAKRRSRNAKRTCSCLLVGSHGMREAKFPQVERSTQRQPVEICCVCFFSFVLNITSSSKTYWKPALDFWKRPWMPNFFGRLLSWFSRITELGES